MNSVSWTRLHSNYCYLRLIAIAINKVHSQLIPEILDQSLATNLVKLVDVLPAV